MLNFWKFIQCIHSRDDFHNKAWYCTIYYFPIFAQQTQNRGLINSSSWKQSLLCLKRSVLMILHSHAIVKYCVINILIYVPLTNEITPDGRLLLRKIPVSQPVIACPTRTMLMTLKVQHAVFKHTHWNSGFLLFMAE